MDADYIGFPYSRETSPSGSADASAFRRCSLYQEDNCSSSNGFKGVDWGSSTSSIGRTEDRWDLSPNDNYRNGRGFVSTPQFENPESFGNFDLPTSSTSDNHLGQRCVGALFSPPSSNFSLPPLLSQPLGLPDHELYGPSALLLGSPLMASNSELASDVNFFGLPNPNNKYNSNSNSSNIPATFSSSSAVGSDIWYLKLLLPDFCLRPPSLLSTTVPCHDSSSRLLDDIQSNHSVSALCSSAGNFFPGTHDRVLLLSGAKAEVSAALFTVLASIKSHIRRSHNPLSIVPEVVVSKIVVPNSTVSTIIGLGGCRIRSVQESTGCFVHVGKRQKGLLERVVEIGSAVSNFDNLVSASLKVAATVQVDTNLSKHLFVDYTKNNIDTDVSPCPSPRPPAVVVSPQFQNFSSSSLCFRDVSERNAFEASSVYNSSDMNRIANLPTQIDIYLNAEAVGIIIGRGGAHLDDILRRSGANVQIEKSFSARRRVSISGTFDSVRQAHFLMLLSVANKNGVPNPSPSVFGKSSASTASAPPDGGWLSGHWDLSSSVLA